MRSIIAKSAILVGGLLVLSMVWSLGQSVPVSAHPLLNITGTPQEPAPPTTVPNTPVPPAATTPPNTPVPSPDTPNRPNTPIPSPNNGSESSHRGTPDLEIIKTVDQQSVMVGDLLGFTLHINNLGDRTAENVVVADSLPDYLDLNDVSTSKGTVSTSGRTITANIGSVSPGEYVQVRFRVYVNASAPAEGSNTGTVGDSNGDSNPHNNTSTTTFTVRQPTPSPTTEPPTPVQVTVAAPTPTPAPQPPAAQRPARPAPVAATLPRTGADDNLLSNTNTLLALLVFGLSSLGLGVYLRRCVKR